MSPVRESQSNVQAIFVGVYVLDDVELPVDFFSDDVDVEVELDFSALNAFLRVSDG
jgi:hypothetical protein